jgi:stage III sporulation protein AA
MDDLAGAVFLLPGDMRAAAEALSGAEEIRLRAGRAPSVLKNGEERLIAGLRKITSEDLDGVLERATGASVHTAQSSIRNGFVSVPGGVRLGLCGSAALRVGEIDGIRRLSSVSIRIPHEMKGCADGIYEPLTDGGFKSTLIISPPGCGKTTLLRELVRRLSDDGYRVSLCDDRGEVAAVWDGEAQFDVGRCTDVMSDAPKGQTSVMLLRAMNPQILAMDEITAPADVQAAEEAVGCGVQLLATAHAAGTADFQTRPLYRRLMEDKVFKNAVTITMRDGRRYYTREALK